MIRAWLHVLAAVGLLTQIAHDIRRIARDVHRDNAGADRYVDISVTLKVVRADPAGVVLIEGARPMSVLREYDFGGVLDTKANPPRLLRLDESPAPNPTVWYCSEDQEPIILHRDEMPVGELALGGMGAGKTTAGVIWLYLRWLEEIAARQPDSPPNEIGITSPTEVRLSLVFNELFRMWPRSWWNYNSEHKIATLADGFRLRGVSTHRQSASQGSRIQAFNWVHLFSDELQDSIEEFIHMQARLRANKTGRAKWYAPATAKDDSAWRSLQATMTESGDWSVHQLLGPNSPFVSPDHWSRMKRSMTERDYRRLVLAEDLPSELAVYYGWLRARNLVARPQIVSDVTYSVLAGYQSYLHPRRSFGLLVGHDPGVIFNTSIVLQLLMFGDVPTWTVVGELQTKQTTAREHAQRLASYLRDEFYVNHPTIDGPLAMAFIDPHGKGEAQTDYQSVYMAFQGAGIDAFNPAPMSVRIKRTARVEMMNRLLAGTADSGGTPRLVVAADARGYPSAPRLVEAFETMHKRAGDDDPEGVRRKDQDDRTHAPVATAYALWMFEQEAYTQQTIATAVRAAKGRAR